MNQPTNSEQQNRLTLCVHIVLKMMQCWRKKTKSFNPFPNDKCCRLDQTDRVCRRQFHVVFFLNGGKFVKQVENIWENTVGKGEIQKTGQKTLWEKEKFLVKSNSTIPTVFSEDLHCRHLNTRACLGKG